MKKRIGISNIFIASLIASAITQGIGTIMILKFWIPVVIPSCGWLITGVGIFAVTFAIYLAVYLTLICFLNKRHKDAMHL